MEEGRVRQQFNPITAQIQVKYALNYAVLHRRIQRVGGSLLQFFWLRQLQSTLWLVGGRRGLRRISFFHFVRGRASSAPE